MSAGPPFEFEGSDALEIGVTPLLSLLLRALSANQASRQKLRSECQRALKWCAYGLDRLRVANHTRRRRSEWIGGRGSQLWWATNSFAGKARESGGAG